MKIKILSKSPREHIWGKKGVERNIKNCFLYPFPAPLIGRINFFPQEQKRRLFK